MANSGLNRNAQHTAGFLSLPLLLLPVFLTLGACASQPTFLKQTAPLRGLTVPTVSEPNFSQISPAMLDFLDKYVEQRRGKEKATFSLVWAATDQNLRRFDYRPELTLSPTETFDQNAGNCLSFSAMFMMMARHLDLNAWYQEVEVPQQWSNNNDTLLVSMHVNVVIESTRSGASWVIDVSGTANSRSRIQRRIEDSVVLAQFYNNLGAEALTEGDLGLAYAYFTKAIDTEPGLHYLWSNLGVVYSRNEQLDDAMQAYLAALELDSGSTMAANNLYMIYEKTGNLQAGADLQKRVEKNRRKNPYYLTHLSTVAYDEGRLEESRELVEKALKLQQNEYRFHYQLARILGSEGRRSEAEASLQRALDLAPADAAENLAHLTALEALPELP